MLPQLLVKENEIFPCTKIKFRDKAKIYSIFRLSDRYNKLIYNILQ